MSLRIWPNNREPYHGDIIQGQLGNCFLIASLQSIASCQPNLLKSIVEISPLRCFFFRHGRRIEVPIEIEPIIPEEYQYAKSTSNDFHWPYIIEQAYVRFHGGRYDNLIGGNTSETFYDLLGLPVIEIDSNEEQLWDKIQKGLRDNTLLVTAGHVEINIENLISTEISNGLRTNHAYVILATYNHLPSREKYVLIHNPQGSNHVKMENNRIRQAFFSSMSRNKSHWSTTSGTQLILWSEIKKSFNRFQLCYLNFVSNQILDGDWSLKTSGGCSNFSTFFQNPYILLPSSFPMRSFFMLGHSIDQRSQRDGPSTKFNYPQIGITLVRLKSHEIPTQDNYDVVNQSKFWNKREICFELELKSMAERQYALVLSSYYPQTISSFWLQIFSKDNFPKVSLSIWSSKYHQTIHGEWNSANSGGRRTKSAAERFHKNPAFLLNISSPSKIYVILQQIFDTFVALDNHHPVGIYILPEIIDKNIIFIKARSICTSVLLKPGENYFIMPTCYDANSFGKYQLDIFSEVQFALDPRETRLPVSIGISNENNTKSSTSTPTKSLSVKQTKSITAAPSKKHGSSTKTVSLLSARTCVTDIVDEYRDLE